MISFGPSIYHEKDGSFRASCNSCRFLITYGKSMCRYRNPMEHVPDPSNTPDWCEMRDDMLRDAADMANDVRHYVMRWSGRKLDEPRTVFVGIPSEAHRKMRLIGRDIKRGSVFIRDSVGNEIDRISPAQKALK
jgi:hypothetical protein